MRDLAPPPLVERALPEGPDPGVQTAPASGAPPLPLESSRDTLAPPSLGRLPALDAARVFATFAIVWTHVAEAQGLQPGWGALGRFGTSFYIIAAAVFLVRSAARPARRRWWEDTKRRAQRLLTPYLVWCAIYGILYGQRAYRAGVSFHDLAFWWGPVAGTAIHLWFLPFIFVWGALGAWLAPRLMKLPSFVLLTTGPLACGFLYWFAYDYVFFAVNRYVLWDYHLHRLDRWIVEVPLFFTALIGACCYFRLPPSTRESLARHRLIWAALGALIFLVAQALYGQHLLWLKELTHTEGRFMANLAGLGLVTVCIAVGHTILIQRLAAWGKTTYLAFLCHMLVLEFTRIVLSWLPGYGSVATAVLSTSIVFGLSVLLALWVHRARYLSYLRP